MEQQKLLSGYTISNFHSPLVFEEVTKFQHGMFLGLLFVWLLIPNPATAIDITKQIHSPLNHPIGKPLKLKLIREQADRLLRLGQQQYAAGSIDKTIESGLKALAIYHSLGDMKSQGLTYDLLAGAYVQLGNIKDAEDALRRRLGIARDNQDFQNQIFALNNLATLLLQKGEPKAAGKTLQDALVISRNLQNIEGQGLSLSNLSLVYKRLGNYQLAIKFAENALVFRRQIGDTLGEINTLNNLGDVYFLAGDYQNTIANYGVAMRLAKRNFNRIQELRAIDGLVTAHISVSRYQRALELTEKRFTIIKFLNNPREMLKSFISAGNLYQKLGDYTKASQFYQQALSLARKLEDSKQEAGLLNTLQELKQFETD